MSPSASLRLGTMQGKQLGETYIKGSASGLADVTNALYENAMNGNPSVGTSHVRMHEGNN